MSEALVGLGVLVYIAVGVMVAGAIDARLDNAEEVGFWAGFLWPLALLFVLGRAIGRRLP